MRYALAADTVVVLHGLFILFALLGGMLRRWRPWIAALHLPAVAWAAWIGGSGGTCPLTPLENRLRALAGEAPYAGGLVERYLVPVVYPPGLTPGIQLALAAGVVAVNVVIYAWVIATGAAEAAGPGPSPPPAAAGPAGAAARARPIRSSPG